MPATGSGCSSMRPATADLRERGRIAFDYAPAPVHQYPVAVRVDDPAGVQSRVDERRRQAGDEAMAPGVRAR